MEVSCIWILYFFLSQSVITRISIEKLYLCNTKKKKKKGNKKRRVLGRDDKIARDNWFGESFGKASMRMAPFLHFSWSNNWPGSSSFSVSCREFYKFITQRGTLAGNRSRLKALSPTNSSIQPPLPKASLIKNCSNFTHRFGKHFRKRSSLCASETIQKF